MQIAERMQGVSGSAIRELFKLLGDPEIISFGGGNPAKECFPKEDIRAITDELLLEKSDILLQYGATEGYLPLRKAYIEKILPDLGLTAKLENVLALTGSMQGLDLICKTVINPGDVVLVEEPSFLGALQTFNVAQAKLVPVPLHTDGLHVDELEALVREHKPVMFYTIPTFQNPTSWVSGVEARKAIARLAAEYDMLVIEDDPYAALRFSGKKLPTIKSFDTSDNVILLSSFSKTISPGMRVALCCGNPELIHKMTIAKQGTDTHSPNLNQAIIAEYLNRDLLPAHIAEISKVYANSARIMTEAMDEHFPDWVNYEKPVGGLFIWCTLPEGWDAQEVFNRAVERKVAFVPGEPFFSVRGRGKNTFRLNFSAEPEARIREGIKRLGGLLKEMAEEKK
ncbi:MAG: PLP-dependent aminotransferase family protein [Eubacteriales bacterium]|nr:PLP-dependent aminotransferase family protein [Eubacteriales bacterium]MDY6089532.1 PLP-dependent aminotransferase family protein [Eubacteriales bacterium]